jgi:two-component system sensor histidine kinase DegS
MTQGPKTGLPSRSSATPTAAAPAEPRDAAALAKRARAEETALTAELGEIELLVQQARSEASRHEGKRAAAAERAAALGRAGGDPRELADLNAHLVTLTRRATVMQTQVDVLEGKLKALARFRDSMLAFADDLGALSGQADPIELGAGGSAGSRKGASARGAGAQPEVMSTGVARMVLSAQEDLRRDIARTMHDGPAQSMTNIVLQAQIAQRLLSRDPALAQAEIEQLIDMVQQTLDATKSFIFDVRPMVLDDLGLVPTIRRAARDRGRRVNVPVDFESFGTERRLSMEMESGLFRMIDEALAAYLASHPDRVSIHLDWSDGLDARVAGSRLVAGEPVAVAAAPEEARGRGRGRKVEPQEAMPVALAEMIADRRAADATARRSVGALPVSIRQDIEQRAASLGVTVEIIDNGREIRLVLAGGT